MSMDADGLLEAQTELLGRLTRAEENLKKIGTGKLSAGIIESRLQTLEANWAQFQRNHESLRLNFRKALTESEYNKSNRLAKVEEMVVEQRGVLLELKYSRQEKSGGKAEHTPTAAEGASRRKLPTIELPHFSGRIEEWPAFRDLFLSMLGRHPSLADVERLHYLKTRVQGEAEERIRNLPTIGENFQRAWAILEERYENKRILVRSCLSTFSATPRMKSESVNDLKGLVHGMLQTAGSLESIGRKSAYDNDFFVHTVIEMLDPKSRREWEDSVSESRDPPSYELLRGFLERRLRTLEAIHPATPEASSAASSKSASGSSRSARSNLAQKQQKKGRCSVCQKDHYILFCSEFQRKSPVQKKEFAESNSLCTNCFGKHALSECLSKKSCVTCSARHHTSIHDACQAASASNVAASTSLHVRHHEGKRATVLLATARVCVADKYGDKQTVRALIDPGSEISLVSEALAQRLRLPRFPAAVSIYGVGGQPSGTTRGRIALELSSLSSAFSTRVSALVLPRISAYGTRVEAMSGDWPHIRDLPLADPEFRAGDPVEVLLGADVYPAIVEEGLRKNGPRAPIAQRTALGWILSGVVDDTAVVAVATSHQCQTDADLTEVVRRFWSQEEAPSAPLPLTDEEQCCEDYFASSHSRTAEGRYIVRLPVASALPSLGDTRRAATRLLRCMEHRFQADTELQQLYSSFMAEYEELGHMAAAPPPSEHERQRTCYLPHHGVLKEAATGKKIRVVFNGSARLPSGDSLNAHLSAGPNLLPALADVISRWRRHRFSLAADVEKMYRQILVHPEDRDLQRILWRSGPTDELKEFRLCTVTYGLTCAPFLAIRAIRQLASDEEGRFPRAAAIIRQDVYVDDILTGADTLVEARALRDEIISLCNAGQFPLRKWASNSDALLKDIPQEHRQVRDLRTWDDDSGHSALGLRWHPQRDYFAFRVQQLREEPVTKRTVLSQTARLFDPMGWLAPVIVRAKILIQTMWLQRLEWDQPVAATEERTWRCFREELPLLERVQVPRWVSLGTAGGDIEVHGFADASERAYAAVVYLRARCTEREWRVSLLQAKTKVAPVQPVSLPRLELCAAALATKVVAHVIQTMRLEGAPVYLWSDSTVTLAWIQGHPSRWKTYVANRVADIQRTLPDARWLHVSGDANPADCASRGLSPGELLSHRLWWSGPEWLAEDIPCPISVPQSPRSVPEERAKAHVTTAAIEEPPLLLRFSRLSRMLRVTAWCRRWLDARRAQRAQMSPAATLSQQELEEARVGWIRHVQARWFVDERRALSRAQPVPGRSMLARLVPFLDEKGIIRVGGRLKHAVLSPDERHPVILPRGSHLTILIIRACHERTLHGGVQLTLGTLRQQYWVPGGRQEVRRLIHRCVPCIRWRAASPQPMMGQLPGPRVTASRPFAHTGVDYAGPIQVRTAAGRGHKAHKAFMAIFVCFATRAVHLELVSSYSTEAFLAAFRRFVSRRGLCRSLYSDRGTNFVGADAELRALFREAIADNRRAADLLASHGVEWRFNPPAAPHFGGLWEAAVKSVKHHLRRVIGDATLTFEELTTVLAQIEACLNSRPLQALSDDPDDITALTPGHFLTGAALNAVPEPSLTLEPSNRLSRWQTLQRMRDDFWARWSKEYLATLTARSKWWRPEGNPSIGDLCLVRGDLSPPCRWPLARIEEVHPGEDGQVRVVTVRTATTTLTRPVAKIVLLPPANCDREKK